MSHKRIHKNIYSKEIKYFLALELQHAKLSKFTQQLNFNDQINELQAQKYLLILAKTKHIFKEIARKYTLLYQKKLIKKVFDFNLP